MRGREGGRVRGREGEKRQTREIVKRMEEDEMDCVCQCVCGT